MRRSDRAAQARRELDRKLGAAELDSIQARPRSGWIRAIRGALGMSQAVLAERLGISGAAVNKLEHAELHGGITIGKLAQVASALDCTLVYALVPNRPLGETVRVHARTFLRRRREPVEHSMRLEDQGVDLKNSEALLEDILRETKPSRFWE